MQRGGRGLRCLFSPDVLDQAVTRDDLVDAQQQQREQRTLLGRTERQRPSSGNDLDRAGDAELHHFLGGGSAMRAITLPFTLKPCTAIAAVWGERCCFGAAQST